MRRRLASTVLFALVLAPAPLAAQTGGFEALQGLPSPEDQKLGVDFSLSLGEVAAGLPDAPANADLSFSGTQEAQEQTIARELDAIRKRDAKAAAALKAELAKKDYGALFDDILKGSGLRSDDLGDVLAAHVAMQWVIANSATAEPSPAALKALRGQLASKLVNAPGVDDPAKRAAMGEELKLKTVLLQAGVQTARDAKKSKAFADHVSSDYAMDGSLRKMTLTDQGFVPRDEAKR